MGDEVTQDGNNVSTTIKSAASGAATGAAMGSVVPGIGTMVGAGIGLLGGVASNLFQGKQQEEGYANQREALQNSISWRVADARRAGIHPLYALGAQPMNISPIINQDNIGPAVQQMGQSISDVQKNAVTEHQKMMQFAEYQVLQSQMNRNDAEAELARTQAQRIATERNNINPPGLGVHNEMGQNPTGGGTGFYDVKAAEEISAKPDKAWSSAGKNPGYQLRYMDNGLPMYLPIAEGDSPEETISEMHPLTWAGLLLRNSRIFGPGWMEDMVKSRYLGISPDRAYKDNQRKRKYPLSN